MSTMLASRALPGFVLLQQTTGRQQRGRAGDALTAQVATRAPTRFQPQRNEWFIDF